MIKTLSLDVMKLFPKPNTLKQGLWNHFSYNGVISNNIKFDIYYKECIDKCRSKPIDRYYSNLNFHFGNKIYHEESFLLLNEFNKQENYYDYKLFVNNESIQYNQINQLVFKKINTYMIANDLELFLQKIKAVYYGRKLSPDEKEIICTRYLNFCDELENSVITRHIGYYSKDLIRIDKYEVPSIIKEYNKIESVIKNWSKLTGRDILVDRLYNIYLDFLLVG